MAKSTIARKIITPPAPARAEWGKPEFIDEVEQGSKEWFELRLGIPTASVFSIVMADGKDGEASKTRRDLLYRLAGEVLTGAPAEGKIVTAAMQRGNDMEPEAVDYYERTNFGAPVRKIGFVRRKLPSGRYVGASPDRLIGPRKGLEIKTLAPHLMIAMLERGAGLPPEHRAQVYGTMMVGDLEEVDLLIYYRGMPVAPKFTVKRDEAEIKAIANAVEIFDHDLATLVKRTKARGGRS